MLSRRWSVAMLAGLGLLALGHRPLDAGQLTVEITGGDGATYVGAFQRWDQDGNLRRAVNPQAKIDVPEVDAVAARTEGNRWVFKNLPPGKYDLVIMGPPRVRIEGWEYGPVLEFDPFFPAEAATDDDTRAFITKDITTARHYENKVVPLAMGGEEKTVRVLVMLIRDQQTSYEGEMPGAATMRFEIWQYEWRYGGWVKQKRTRVMHRVIVHRDELRRWTWLWDPKLGGIQIGAAPKTVRYDMPALSDPSLKGLRPY